jgi:uncharacterized protein YeeX (DUF496 family)
MKRSLKLQSFSMSRGTRRNVGIIAAVVLITAAALWYSTVAPDPDLKKALQTASLSFFFGSMLGGVVKFLLDEFDRGRQKRAEQAQFLLNILSDLKSVYDRTERAKVLIPAHQSAKTYGEEMRDLIEARVKLLNIVRAVRFPRVSGIEDEKSENEWNKLTENVDSMATYLETLIDDFQRKNKELSETQRKYEATIKAYVEKTEKDSSLALKSPDNEPWAKICELESMKDFLKPEKSGATEGTNYQKQFLSQLDKASKLLREQLRRVL